MVGSPGVSLELSPGRFTDRFPCVVPQADPWFGLFDGPMWGSPGVICWGCPPGGIPWVVQLADCPGFVLCAGRPGGVPYSGPLRGSLGDSFGIFSQGELLGGSSVCSPSELLEGSLGCFHHA
jgi:hypothetical protein